MLRGGALALFELAIEIRKIVKAGCKTDFRNTGITLHEFATGKTDTQFVYILNEGLAGIFLKKRENDFELIRATRVTSSSLIS